MRRIEKHKIAGTLPLNEYRELATAKFIVSSNVLKDSFTKNEVELRSDVDFPKRANAISSQVTVATYTDKLIKESGVKVKDLAMRSL